MPKKTKDIPPTRKIVIDTSVWTSQVNYSKEYNVPMGTLAKRVARAKANISGSMGIEYWEIPELSITLVKR